MKPWWIGVLLLVACAPQATLPQRHVESRLLPDGPADRTDAIVASMSRWKIETVASIHTRVVVLAPHTRMVVIPYDDYRLVMDQARDYRNHARKLEQR